MVTWGGGGISGSGVFMGCKFLLDESDLRGYDSKMTPLNVDAFAKTYRMAKQKFRSTRLGVFSGVKAYI
jgi:hypothetical protein